MERSGTCVICQPLTRTFKSGNERHVLIDGEGKAPAYKPEFGGYFDYSGAGKWMAATIPTEAMPHDYTVVFCAVKGEINYGCQMVMGQVPVTSTLVFLEEMIGRKEITSSVGKLLLCTRIKTALSLRFISMQHYTRSTCLGPHSTWRFVLRVSCQ